MGKLAKALRKPTKQIKKNRGVTDPSSAVYWPRLVLLAMAAGLTTISAIRTWDVVARTVPVLQFGSLDIAGLIPPASVLFLDGGFLLVTFILPFVTTKAEINVLQVTRFLLLAFMAYTNISDAGMNNIAGGSAWAVVSGAVVLFLFLVTLAESYDPRIMAIRRQSEIAAEVNEEVHKAQMLVGQKLAPSIALAVSVNKAREMIVAQTGQQPEAILKGMSATFNELVEDILSDSSDDDEGDKEPEPPQRGPEVLSSRPFVQRQGNPQFGAIPAPTEWTSPRRDERDE